MDDLRMVRDVLGDAPAPSTETAARARAALLERAASGSAVAGLAASGRRRGAAGPRSTRNRPAGRNTGWWRWSLGGGLGISGAVAAALVVPALLGPTATVPTGPVGGGSTSLPATVAIGDGDDAGTVLRLVAANAGLGQRPPARPGQFVYRVSEDTFFRLIGDPAGDGPVARIREGRRHELWYTVDGLRAARTRITEGVSRVPLTPADAEAARKLGYDLSAPPKVEEHGPAPDYQPPADCETCPAVRDPGAFYRPTPEYLAGLPTDPARLLATLRKDVGDQNKHAPDQEVFTGIMDLLREAYPIVPTEQRAALYRAVALIPGVERVAGQVELGGRQGVAIGRVDDPTADPTQRRELVFDTSGRELLGFRDVSVRAANGVPAGTVVYQSALSFTVVDRVGEDG